MELTQLKEELDSTLLQFFETLDKYYQAQAALGSQMSSGLFNMSRARYNMGVKSVSISQIHRENMVASVKVDSSTSSEPISSQVLFQLINVPKLKEEITSRESSEKESELRQRKTKGDKARDGQVEDVGCLETEEKEEKEKKKGSGNGLVDPLRWFGVLVPQTLRQSQTDFKRAVESVVQVANLKYQLMSLASEYRELMKKKADCDRERTDTQE